MDSDHGHVIVVTQYFSAGTQTTGGEEGRVSCQCPFHEQTFNDLLFPIQQGSRTSLWCHGLRAKPLTDGPSRTVSPNHSASDEEKREKEKAFVFTKAGELSYLNGL